MTTLINHDYPLAGEMLVVDLDDVAIEGVHIQVFEYTLFQAGDIDTWVGETTSDVTGAWLDPIEVEDGATYIILFQKYNEYGPTHVEVTT